MSDLPPRLANKIIVDEAGCWIWQGAQTGDGYGHLKWEGKHPMAHRVTYSLLVGAIPAGLTLDHKCRVRLCVNPGHAEPVTKRENTRRGVSVVSARMAQTHCKNGHPLAPPNLYYGRGGAMRICKTCRLAYMKEYHAKKALAAAS